MYRSTNRRGEYGRRVSDARQDALIGQSYDDIYMKQITEFRNLRGFDELGPELAPGLGMYGGIVKIPRTTNADVSSLVDYWDKALDSAKEVEGHADAVKRWRQTRADVYQYRNPFRDRAADSAVYSKNNIFWREVKRLAVHVAAAKEAPSKWEMAKASAVQSVKDLPGRVYEASTVGPAKIREATGEAAGSIARGTGAVVKDFFSTFSTPLLIGAGLIGTFFVVKATRPSTKARD